MSALSHREEVCRLYRKCLRLAFDWITNRKLHRDFVLGIRRQFDLHRDQRDPTQQALLKDAVRYLLWKYRHPEPYVCTESSEGAC